MQQKMKWFFGTKNPQKGSYYNGYVAELNEKKEICIKKFQIPRIEFKISTMYEDVNGRKIFSVCPKHDDVYYLNKLREKDHDEILLGVTGPEEGQPYDGYIVEAKGNGITMRKYSSTPLTRIITTSEESPFNCNKQFFVCFEANHKKRLVEIV